MDKSEYLVSSAELSIMFAEQEILNRKYTGDEWRKVVKVGSIKVALLDEVSEFLREVESDWKWWKFATHKDKNAALFELIDIIHFALMLVLHKRTDSLICAYIDEYPVEPTVYGYAEDRFERFSRVLVRFLDSVDHQRSIDILAENLCNVIEAGGYILDLEPGKVFEAYMIKNNINHGRVSGGVMDGTYDKSTEVTPELIKE